MSQDNKDKSIKLRVFNVDIKSTELSSSTEVMQLFLKSLEEKKKVADRKLQLNQQDNEEDLLSSFQIKPNSYIFGLMMSIVPSASAKVLDNNLFNKDQITINDLENLEEDSNKICQNMYYFMLNNKYVITTLSGKASIDRTAVYFNWLIDKHRGSASLNLLPKLVEPEIDINNIKSFEFGGNISVQVGKENTKDKLLKCVKIKDLSRSVLSLIFGAEETLKDIDLEELIDAKLVLSLNKKAPLEKKEDLKKALSAIVKHLPEDDVILKDKNNKKINSVTIKDVREIKVGCTKNGYINEEDLKQKMENVLLSLG